MAFRHVLASTILIILFTSSPGAPAEYEKGLIAYGHGDYRAALEQWGSLADKGSAQAQFNLAFMYDNGQGVAHDYDLAAEWYMAAAEQGHPAAAWNLGMMYTAGQGVPQDFVEAYKWLSLSAFFGAEDVSVERRAIADLLTPSQRKEAETWIWSRLPR